MSTDEFEQWMERLKKLTPQERKALEDAVEATRESSVAVGGGVTHSTIITGDNNQIHALNQDTDPAHARHRYLNYMASKTRDLPLRGLDKGSADAQSRQVEGPCLTDVYIDLDTNYSESPRRVKETTEEFIRNSGSKPLSALAAFAATRRMVLLGDPGSGKSTFVNHLVHCLARGQAMEEGANLPWPKDLPEAWKTLLPVWVILREMAAWMRKSETKSEKAGLLEEYLGHWLKDAGLSDFAKPLLQQMRDGRAILFLDGWDEISKDEPVFACLGVMLNELPATFTGCSLLVTCRVRSYAEELWQLNSRWQTVTLLEFDDAKIDQFVEAWYRQLASRGEVRDWPAYAERLKVAVRRPDLRRMAGNPLLLTIMALDHADKGELPDARSVVYEDVVELLLWKWRHLEKPDVSTPSLRDLLRTAGRQEIDLKRLLWQVAFEAHDGAKDKEDGERTADISELTLRKRFAELPESGVDWQFAEALLTTMRFGAGLLVPSVPENFAFPHRTFQEYLAACHICSQGDVVQTALELARRGVYWWEVVLLAVNRLVYHQGDKTRPFALVRELCPPKAPGARDTDCWQLISLAGECVREIGVGRAESQEEVILVQRVRERLVQLVSDGRLTVSERVRAGSTLGTLGDPRNLGEMIHIPAGPFMMGDDKDKASPRHVVELDAFSIRKYAVTEGEYAEFVAMTGHRAPFHWRNGVPLADHFNHPVTRISWEDAQAYCDWAGMALPTEAQWEKAARGTDERVYPWGDDWKSEKCHSSKKSYGDVGGTAPVGIYPTDSSAYGCLDMAGNVLEWCADWYNSEYYKSGEDNNPQGPADGEYRVLRGGSWNYIHPVNFRAAARNWLEPDIRFDFVGFRCVSRADSV